MGILCWICFDLYYFVFLHFFQSFWYERDSWLLSYFVFQMSCFCKCSVALPQVAIGWSAVCDCGICWSYTHLRFFVYYKFIVLSTNIYTHHEELNVTSFWKKYPYKSMDTMYRSLILIWFCFCLFVWFDSLRPLNNLSVMRDRSSWVEPALS